MNRLNDPTYNDYYLKLFEDLKLRIASEADDYIIAQPTEDLLKYYCNQALSPIEFDTNKDETIEHKKYIKTIRAHERDRAYRQDGDLNMEGEKIIVKLPIIPNNDINKILNLRTQSISLSGGPNFNVDRNNIVFEIEIKGYGINLDIHQVDNAIITTKSSIKSYLTRKNREIASENSGLKTKLSLYINSRKEKLDLDKKRINELVNLIKIPLARKDGEIVKKITIDKKPFIKKIKPKTPEEDYQLDREKVVDIIKLINNQCLQFEKTPKTYNKFDEPNLRDLLLSNLNSIFEGQATGETFNFHGKTDIYLNIDKGNILVTECKFYSGEKKYHETIDQLLGYLTWRQNFGIMLSFCRQKNFTKILDDAESIIKSHTSYESGFIAHDKSHFISRHTLPGDDYKYVEIHHLYFNLYIE
jgi:hypothetical protein